MGEMLGFNFLGGDCAVTELIQDPGKLCERRWEAYAWCLPDSGIIGCWWLTNPLGDAESTPKLYGRASLCCVLSFVEHAWQRLPKYTRKGQGA